MQNNKSKQKNFSSLIFFFVFFVVSLFVYSPVQAQSVVPLIVAPARQSLAGDPGKNVSFQVRFYNTSDDPIVGTFKVADFIVSDNLGTPSFIEGPEVLADRFSAAKWISLSSEKGVIAKNGITTINGVINLPIDAAPGGKYFAVFFEPDTKLPDPNGETQQEAALVSMRVAGLVYLRVNGPITENASIVKFKAPGFSEYGPVTIATEIKNGGVYHISPVGQLVVKNMFGKEVSNAKIGGVNIFPEASRLMETKVGEKWMIGRFTAELNIAYGESGKSLNSTLAFWVFPWKLATIIILAIIIIILLISTITNKFAKKENKLEEELIKEKDELEKLKEKYQDLIESSTSLNQEQNSKTSVE